MVRAGNISVTPEQKKKVCTYMYMYVMHNCTCTWIMVLCTFGSCGSLASDVLTFPVTLIWSVFSQTFRNFSSHHMFMSGFFICWELKARDTSDTTVVIWCFVCLFTCWSWLHFTGKFPDITGSGILGNDLNNTRIFTVPVRLVYSETIILNLT